MTGRVSIERIKAVVAADFGVPPAAIDTHRRFKKYVLPRHVAMYFACSLTDLSFPTIGRLFAHRDHTTVYHAYRKISALRGCDAALECRLQRIEELLQPPQSLAHEIQLSFLIGPLFDQARDAPRPTLRMLEAA